MNRTQIRALTFDCYGTLIDWDGGARAALENLPSLVGSDMQRLVVDREEEELELLRGPFRLYGEILSESLARAANRQGKRLAADEMQAFIASMGEWPAFEDAPDALQRLSSDFLLVIVSNVENETLEKSVEKLGAPFAHLVTAEDVQSYKPAPAHFEEALRRLELPSENVLHVAGSLVHDIVPARQLGWRAAWINRRDEVVPSGLDSELVFPGLAALATALGV